MTARAEISIDIHPAAQVDPGAELGENVRVGPFATIAAGAVIGADTEIMAGAHILTGVTIGSGSTIHHGAVLGGLPQDRSFNDHPTPTFIGSAVEIREYVTVHRSSADEGTFVDDGSLLMAYCHIGHDSRIGRDVVLANGVQIGGRVQVDDYANIGGMTPVHQNCRIGAHAFVGGGYRVVQDVPPYILAVGEPLKFGGLNVIGLRRHRLGADVRAAIKEAYRLIFRSESDLKLSVAAIRETLPDLPEIATILKFVEASERGLI